MNIPWDEISSDQVRAEARREALDVTKAAFGALADRLERHVAGGYRPDTRRALQIMKAEIDLIVSNIEKELNGK